MKIKDISNRWLRCLVRTFGRFASRWDDRFLWSQRSGQNHPDAILADHVLRFLHPKRRQRYLPPVFGGKPGGAMRVTGPGGGYEITRRTQIDDPSLV